MLLYVTGYWGLKADNIHSPKLKILGKLNIYFI